MFEVLECTVALEILRCALFWKHGIVIVLSGRTISQLTDLCYWRPFSYSFPLSFLLSSFPPSTPPFIPPTFLTSFTSLYFPPPFIFQAFLFNGYRSIEFVLCTMTSALYHETVLLRFIPKLTKSLNGIIVFLRECLISVENNPKRRGGRWAQKKGWRTEPA